MKSLADAAGWGDQMLWLDDGWLFVLILGAVTVAVGFWSRNLRKRRVRTALGDPQAPQWRPTETEPGKTTRQVHETHGED